MGQLNALKRKRLVESTNDYQDFQVGKYRQEVILRRKTEETAKIQKQLNETFENQKQVAEKRNQAFERKESSQCDVKLPEWITQEIELSVGLAEARLNLNKLIEERKDTAAELHRLTAELAQISDDEDAAPPKRKLFKEEDNGATPTHEETSGSAKKQIQTRIERLKEDIECKNIQIKQIQQMLIEGDQGFSTLKFRFFLFESLSSFM